MADRRPRLVIFAKAPAAGRVKTRLGREIGMTVAATWARHMLRMLVRDLGRDPRWETLLAVSPDRAAAESRLWPAGPRRIAQGPGDLGMRMARVFRDLPPGPVVLIGSDIPGVTPALVAEAFGHLGRADAVFGPATDGGYWLVGLARGRRRLPAGLFRGVRWSTRHALADTLATLPGHRIAFAAPLADIDEAEDWRAHLRRDRRGDGA
jgi:hypothetical protein